MVGTKIILLGWRGGGGGGGQGANEVGQEFRVVFVSRLGMANSTTVVQWLARAVQWLARAVQWLARAVQWLARAVQQSIS
jgi:hypothetical protein